MKTNLISPKIEHHARKFVSGIGRGDALLPIILLEAAVTGGRTYNAYKRGGFVEARERGTEETLGAIFWLGGVSAFNKMGDAIGKKILKLDNVDFEVGKDAVRDPLKNYMHKTPKYGAKTLAAFKFTKIISSILLANSVIGFVVPKLNQAITNKYQSSVNEMNGAQKTPQDANKEMKASTSKNNPSFKGMGVNTLLMLSNSFENDARYKLISTDVGIAGGRAANARNKHERREILFRDLSSVYFYMFCRIHLNSMLNSIESGRAERLDPVSAKILDNHLQDNLRTKPSFSAEEFEKLVLGDKNAQIPKKVQDKFVNGIIKLNDFKTAVGQNSLDAKLAENMAKLQPQIEGVSILTKDQVKDVFAKGLINNPENLNKVFEEFSGKKSTNPMAYFPEKDLRKIKQQMVDYAQDIINKAKSNGENITLDTLKKANKSNFRMNAINLGLGFAVSAYFLATAIPKIQYWITRKTTGQDKFPGVEKYEK